MIRFALDLEMEQPSNKIIQIGVCKFNESNGEILDKLNRFIKLDEPLSDYIKVLTGITDDDLVNGISLKQTYLDMTDFTADCSLQQAVTWGQGDIVLLKKQLFADGQLLEFYKNQTLHKNQVVIDLRKDVGEPVMNVIVPKWIYGERIMDVKTLHQFYAPMLGLNRSGGLSKVMNKYGLQFLGRKHNAVCDSENTARLYLKLKEYVKKPI